MHFKRELRPIRASVPEPLDSPLKLAAREPAFDFDVLDPEQVITVNVFMASINYHHEIRGITDNDWCACFRMGAARPPQCDPEGFIAENFALPLLRFQNQGKFAFGSIHKLPRTARKALYAPRGVAIEVFICQGSVKLWIGVYEALAGAGQDVAEGFHP